MAERPILFNTAMVRAIVAGTKTQTRRVVKPPRSRPAFVLLDHGNGWWPYQSDDGESELCDDGMEHPYTCPYGQPGDRLWVREAWAYHLHAMAASNHEMAGPWVYAADGEQAIQRRLCDRWRPSIHMPRCASRITLEVTAVRVERLQEISADDARAEGCPDKPVPGAEQASVDVMAKLWFHELWCGINGPGSWDANPWVWVVEFKRVTP